MRVFQAMYRCYISTVRIAILPVEMTSVQVSTQFLQGKIWPFQEKIFQVSTCKFLLQVWMSVCFPPSLTWEGSEEAMHFPRSGKLVTL